MTADQQSRLKRTLDNFRDAEPEPMDAEARIKVLEDALTEISRIDGCTLEHMRNIASRALAQSKGKS